MELKNSYKQTEIGVIPNDWTITKLSELAIFNNGKAHEQFIDEMGDYIVVNSKFISTEGKVFKTSNHNLCPLNAGDITMVMSDIPNGKALAKCFIIPVSGKYTLNQRICSIRSSIANNDFLSLILNRNKYYLSFDSGTGQTNLKRQEVLDCPVQMPPTKAEQAAIAKALSDANAWIESLTRIIKKKQQIKQAALRNLMAPKEKWVEKRLESTATLKARIGWQGLTTSEYLANGDYYLVTGTDFKDGAIDWDNCHFVAEMRYKQDRNIQLKSDDVLVTKDGTIGKIAFIDKLDKPATLNSGVFVIRPKNDEFYPLFFYYVLSSSVFSDFLNQLSAGSTINHLYQKDFIHFTFKAPRSIDEQKEISRILSDMDNDITKLERKLSKARQIKLGMMQNLLTGRIRLI